MNQESSSDGSQADDQFRRNDDTFFALIRNNPFGIYVIDSEFRLRQVSLGAQKVFESVRPLLGRNFAEVLHTIWPEPFASDTIARFQHTLKTGEPYSAPNTVESRADIMAIEAYDWRIERICMPDGKFGVVCYFYDLSERQRWEAALKGSEERLRLALTASRMVAWEWTTSDRKLRVSDNAVDVFGLTDQTGLTVIDQGLALLHPDDAIEYRKTFNKAIDELGSYLICYRLIRPLDGRTIWIEERGNAAPNPTGGVRLYGVATDITDRQRAEAALQESEDRSSFVRRSSGVGFWYCDLPFDVLQWDDLVKSHFNFAKDEVVTIEKFYDRIHPEDREPTRSAIERSISGRTSYNVDYRTVDPKTGRVTWVRAIGRTFYATDGTPTRFDGITFDVTDQKRAEASLRESEQRFREMANAAPAMIWVTNERHECTFLSQSWCDFTGQSAEDGLGFGWFEAVHVEDRENAQATFISAAAKVEPFKLDYRLRTSDGNYRWVIDAGKPRFTESGEFRGFVGSVIDDHERHEFQQALTEAREAAEAANESKSAFLANMSHEIRTPMTAILGYAELLKDSLQHDDAVQYLQTIRNNGNYLLGIINDILDLSKIEAGKLEVENEHFELHKLIEDVRSIMEVRAKENGLSLQVCYHGKLPKVIRSDAKRLKQILINLVGNAIKFTQQGKVQIGVRFHAATRQLQLEVMDTGIGISPSQMPRLFKPFSQGDASVSRNFGGTGLGLIISQRLAKMLNGSISANSVQGVGSTFTVSIAIEKTDSLDLLDYGQLQSDQETLAATHAPQLACDVLIVDDRRDIRFLSKYILQQSGATVNECEDGLVAVEHVSARLHQDGGPDLILLDMQMPVLDGYATAQRLRTLGYAGPILALTADAMQSDMNKCLQAGCNDYLSKPIDKLQLLSKVAEWTTGSKLGTHRN